MANSYDRIRLSTGAERGNEKARWKYSTINKAVFHLKRYRLTGEKNPDTILKAIFEQHCINGRDTYSVIDHAVCNERD